MCLFKKSNCCWAFRIKFYKVYVNNNMLILECKRRIYCYTVREFTGENKTNIVYYKLKSQLHSL